MNKLVSVIVPAYNCELYIDKCIQSILNQSYKNLELILIDDASTDDTYSICEKYRTLDLRVIVIRTECQKGSIFARKLGVEASNGDYITFVDADDWIDIETIQKFVNYMLYGYDFISTGLVYEYADGSKKLYKLEDREYQDTATKEECMKKMVSCEGGTYDICPSSCAKCYKRDFLIKCLSQVCNNVTYGEDAVTTLLCISNASKFRCYSDIYYHYLQRNDSKQHTIERTDLCNILVQVYTMRDILYNSISIDKTCQKKLNENLFQRLISIENKLLEKNNLRLPVFYFHPIEYLFNKRIVIYGAGDVGKDYYAQITKYTTCTITHWIDRNWNKITIPWCKLEPLSVLINDDYDVIVIAVKTIKIANEIKYELVSNKIDPEKIIWNVPKKIGEFAMNE